MDLSNTQFVPTNSSKYIREYINTNIGDLINKEPKLGLDIDNITENILKRIRNNTEQNEIDEVSYEYLYSLILKSYDYSILSSRLLVKSIHNNTKSNIIEIIDEITKNNKEFLNEKYINFCRYYQNVINENLCFERDYNLNFMALKTLINAFLLTRKDSSYLKGVIERPQHMYMRTAIGIHMFQIDENGITTQCVINNIIETYNLLSQQIYTHATPTLFNCGLKEQSLSSCFLLEVPDNLDRKNHSITTFWQEIASISKKCGGIGFHVSSIRGKGSKIKSTNGVSQGIFPMLKVSMNILDYVSQGGGKRNGSGAAYIEPWHIDTEEILNSQLQHNGDENSLLRNLFIGLWVPDIFMKRIKQQMDNPDKDITWSMFCPSNVGDLCDVYGEEFERKYITFEKNFNIPRKTISIKKLTQLISKIITEKGYPYICFKDTFNRKCNQNNLGVIKSSNLCTEISIYSDENNIGVCNLASITLPKFVEYNSETSTNTYNYQKLYEVTRTVVRNLNNVIDSNTYVTDKAKNADYKHRPLGLGVNGLADVFLKFRIPFVSDESKIINKRIFETIYYAALTESCEIAKNTQPYSSYPGSLVSQGKLQFDLWDNLEETKKEQIWDWKILRENINLYGIKNSLLIALMPTCTTSIIIGTNESFEPITSNIYKKRTLAGEFCIVNKYLMQDLKDLGLWSANLKDRIVLNNGSIQDIDEIPKYIKDIYKTIYEYSNKDLIDMEVDRNRYVCQSTSSNRYMSNVNNTKLLSLLYYTWERGLKTGMYYLRQDNILNSAKFSVDPKLIREKNKTKEKPMLCNLDSKEECLACTV
jgi:ribonucleoside-diphosphate reductase alpha chain